MTIAELLAKGPHWAMYNPVGRQAFAKAYLENTGKAACMSCPADLYTKYFELKKMMQTENNNPTPRKYTLKKGVSLQVRFGTPLTNDTLTDEKAAQILADLPHLATYFDILPDEPTAQPETTSHQNTEQLQTTAE